MRVNGGVAKGFDTSCLVVDVVADLQVGENTGDGPGRENSTLKRIITRDRHSCRTVAGRSGRVSTALLEGARAKR